MKTLIILILLVVLGGGSYLSKPTEADFAKLIHEKMASEKKDDLFQLILHGGQGKADLFLKSCKVNDKFFYMQVEREGKVIYTGAFSKWFANDLKIATR